MYSKDQILEIFKEKEVLLSGHFRLTSGRHAAIICSAPACSNILMLLALCASN